jgi:protease-4
MEGKEMIKYLIPLVFVLLTGCQIFPINLALFAPPGPLDEVTIKRGKTSDKVLILEVDGLITASSSKGMLSDLQSPVAFLKERLMMARRDEDIKAVVLRVNSPGGGVTASDVMYEELRRFRQKTELPIIACFMDVAASGGYYISMSADKIVCHPTGVTGSIGVIAQLATIDKMLEKLGIEPLTLKSGKHKDIGTPLRIPTEDEKKILQDLVDAMYNRFVEVVAEGRQMDREKVIELADGRIYDANAAKKAGLVDEVGYLDDAIALAEQTAGIEHAKIVMYKRPGGYRSNIYSAEAKSGENSLSKLAESLLPALGSRFYYLWIPGK